MTDAELDNLAHRTAIDCHISNGNITTLSGIILAALQKVSEAERRERGLKSIDRICDTCGGEKDSEGRCAMCLQSKLTAAEAQLAECQKELADRWPRDTQDWYENLEAEHGRLKFQFSRLTAEVERLRECLQSMLDAYEELHAKYDLGDCEATIAARAAMSNPEKQ